MTASVLWVWLTDMPDGTEGIVTAEIPGFGFAPLVTVQLANVEFLEEIAEEIRRMSGKQISRVLFQRVEDPP